MSQTPHRDVQKTEDKELNSCKSGQVSARMACRPDLIIYHRMRVFNTEYRNVFVNNFI